ncbi:MAG: flavin reductase family protein [Candidatus Eisenbacteria bacterium]
MILEPGAVSPGAMYHFMISLVVPRPIAFVSTVSPAGRRNLSPFSFFNAISGDPPLVGISILDRPDDPKDTLRNIRDTREFVVSLVNEPLLGPMVETSGDWPADADEFEVAGLAAAPSDRVRPPRVAASPVAMECRLYQEITLGSAAFVVGEILRVHVADEVLTDGRVDAARLLSVGRLGGDGYCEVRDVIHKSRPTVTRA